MTTGLMKFRHIKNEEKIMDDIMRGQIEYLLVVLNKFTQNFPSYNYIVVWTRDTYELVKRDMKKYRVVILQEVLGIVAFNGEGKEIE